MCTDLLSLQLLFLLVLSSTTLCSALIPTQQRQQRQRDVETSPLSCNHSNLPLLAATGNRRDAILFSSWAFSVLGVAGVTVLPSTAAEIGALNAGEMIRRSVTIIPGYGQTDIFFPDFFAGTWKVTREVEFSGRPDSTLLLSYNVRFIRSIEEGAVVADRGYNQAELDKSIAAFIKGEVYSTPVRSYEWVQTNPNDIRIYMSDGTKKEIKVTKRATERTNDTVWSSEFQRVTLEHSRGIPEISSRRVVSKWRTLDHSSLEALEIVYDMGGGDPLAGRNMSSGAILSKSRLLLVR